MNELENIQIYFNERPEYMTVDIWVIKKGAEYDQNITFEEGLLKLTKIDYVLPLDESKPFLRLPRSFADMFFKAISERLSERGVKTKDQNLIEGKIQATENHLKDMQEITKELIKYLTK